MVRRSAVAAALVLGCAGFVASGCAVAGRSADTAPAETSTSVMSVQVATTQSAVDAGAGDDVFAVLADAMRPVPVFGLTALPAGVAVAPEWWPVIDGVEPAENVGRGRNPHLEGEGGPEPEAQLLLSYKDGWLLLVENFRGDLGDVSGEAVGSVEGMPAYLYEVNGGLLVQWSHEGRWYGVFCRGVPREIAVSTALQMRLLERY